MKILGCILGILFFLSCDSNNASDCFQTSGPIVQEEVQVDPFSRILVNRGVELILKQDTEYRIIIESGENLIGDVSVNLQGNQLILTDNNTCNYVRDYISTKVYVSAPNLTEIRSSTQYDISSDGILSYPNLALSSEDFFAPGTYTSGDFRLNINANELKIITNNLSSQYITGTVETLNINFASGAGRFEGANLLAQDVIINHRGSNDMIINPQQSLTGQLRGTGDLISVNQPPTVNVEQLYTGQLIFQ
ncbi:head GIN domain-containing protein [Ichthyenterobacterium sp. W332]|uniref:Head GIN domain-containing protein n=1 Tax=Microcosmobacter mediterraneus TaxID=3075607 RepID=A0ABU2YMX3_9FLAO|nr:head GIN domain-containing protein [Ichthyenterobacterium sp. W332]MDT0559019.1 head GIN domain-containing protein [Ichthyenterobacterium sp. W332]